MLVPFQMNLCTIFHPQLVLPVKSINVLTFASIMNGSIPGTRSLSNICSAMVATIVPISDGCSPQWHAHWASLSYCMAWIALSASLNQDIGVFNSCLHILHLILLPPVHGVANCTYPVSKSMNGSGGMEQSRSQSHPILKKEWVLPHNNIKMQAL